MEQLTWMLAGMLRNAAGLLPPGRRQWAEAVRAEAGQVPAGWPRLRWLAGGLWLAAREGAKVMISKVVYRLGAVAVAALAAWVVWLSWRTSPAADPQTVTDRVRVLVGAAALAVLPWVGRRRGWFGPVGSSITARLVRLAGCAAVCGLGVAVVRMDSHLGPLVGPGPLGPGPFSLPREIAAVVLLGAALAARAVGKARWPDAEPSALWALPAIAGLFMFALLPLQALAIVYVAGILAATSRRSPAANVSLAAGTIAGLAAGLAAVLAVYAAAADDSYVGPLVLGMRLPDVPARRPRGRGGGLAAARYRGPAGAARGADPSGTARGLGGRSCLRPAAHQLLRGGRVHDGHRPAVRRGGRHGRRRRRG